MQACSNESRCMLYIECTKRSMRRGGFEEDILLGVQFCSVLFSCLPFLHFHLFFLFLIAHFCLRVHMFGTCTNPSLCSATRCMICKHIYAVCMRLEAISCTHSLLVCLAALVRSIACGSSLDFRWPFILEGKMHVYVVARELMVV